MKTLADQVTTRGSDEDRELPAAGVRGSANVRLVIGFLSIASLGIGGLTGLAGLDTVRTIALLLFATVGVGSAPWQLNTRLDLPARLTLTGTTSLAVWIIPTAAMVRLDAWRPVPLTIATFAGCGLLHVLAITALVRRRHFQLAWFGGSAGTARDGTAQPGAPVSHGADGNGAGGEQGASQRRFVDRIGQLSPARIAAIGALTCLASALAHRHTDPGFWGFLPHIGIAWYAGLVLVLMAFLIARRAAERQLAVIVVFLFLVLAVTPALVYDGPGSQSAYKHADLIAQIKDLHFMDAAVAVYNSWPGFFSGTAWVCDVAGIRDVMGLALFWPVLIGLFGLVAMRHLAGQLLTDPCQRWGAVTLGLLANSMETDYFSPQSVGLALGVATYGIALMPGLGRLRLPVVLMAGCTLTVTHQLSPFVVGGVLLVLVLFRQLHPWWAPLLVLGPASAWAWLHRDSLRNQVSWAGFLRPSNFRPPAEVASPGLSRLPIVTWTVVAVVVGILVLGVMALVVLVRRRGSRRAWALACCPVVGLALVAVVPYGQEGIFRSAAFGLPWLAILAAAGVASSQRGWSWLFLPRRGWAAALPAALGILTICFLVSTCGLDAFTITRQADVGALEYAGARSGPNYDLLLLGPGDLPTTLRPGPETLQRPDLGLPAQPASPPQEMRRMTEGMARSASAPGTEKGIYALWSPVQVSYASAYGLDRPRDLVALRNAFTGSPYWTVVFEQDGTVLFELDGSRFRAETAP